MKLYSAKLNWQEYDIVTPFPSGLLRIYAIHFAVNKNIENVPVPFLYFHSALRRYRSDCCGNEYFEVLLEDLWTDVKESHTVIYSSVSNTIPYVEVWMHH
jgi:hypothetical protein